MTKKMHKSIVIGNWGFIITALATAAVGQAGSRLHLIRWREKLDQLG